MSNSAILLTLTVVFVIGPLSYNFVTKDRGVQRQSAGIVFDTVTNSDFAFACDREGRRLDVGERSCFDRGRYRFWRVGLATSIGIITTGDKPFLLYETGIAGPGSMAPNWVDVKRALRE